MPDDPRNELTSDNTVSDLWEQAIFTACKERLMDMARTYQSPSGDSFLGEVLDGLQEYEPHELDTALDELEEGLKKAKRLAHSPISETYIGDTKEGYPVRVVGGAIFIKYKEEDNLVYFFSNNSFASALCVEYANEEHKIVCDWDLDDEGYLVVVKEDGIWREWDEDEDQRSALDEDGEYDEEEYEYEEEEEYEDPGESPMTYWSCPNCGARNKAGAYVSRGLSGKQVMDACPRCSEIVEFKVP